MSEPVKLTDASAYESFLDKYDTFLIDCDGVIWHGNNVLPNLREALSVLRKKGKKLLFVSNNSATSRKGYLKKFKKLNIEIHDGEVFGSAYASAYYIKNVLKFPKEKKVYVVGDVGIIEELESEGIRYAGANEDSNFDTSNWDYANIKQDPEVGAVLCGFDIHVNYLKYAKAFTYLNSNPECLFFLTNDDPTFPANGTVYPGGGAIAAPLITALGRNPDGIFGKPNKPMLDCIIQHLNLNPERTCMIGDRLDTDILFGTNGGLGTLFVLTGVNKEQDILAKDARIIPDYYMASLGDFSIL
ncbi:5510_t:CDS:2 [Funneliformis geosporum]|uniref:4-nitrophenylphosphatase n=1 Tax=Funneliformis geosporum TaxID=1117311 RepID=A0A9W4SUG0_9GLOM|nr:5510_t:CDS:2 [Funneliformis geosporum]CAI2181764.1 10584_t:CDS:2 [Funneliformis geosporum]